MTSLALEEKITKIRLRNEEIKRRYEEVEADKKNAAKLDALMKPIPPEDWPTRKEPPEFSTPVSKHTAKPKHSIRKHADQPGQHYTGSSEGKKNHTFADGQGPPPDPKYNFLADSEREEPSGESSKDFDRTKGRNKSGRGGFKRRGSGRDWPAKEHWNQHEAFGNPTHPEYEAWRAERNRIDEARISRQRTAEGSWRREWDNDKIHLVDDTTKRENRVTLGEVVTRKEHNDKEHYRLPRTATKLPHPGRESHEVAAEPIRNHGGAIESEKRVVIATEKSIKVLLNAQPPTPPRPSVMSVKVSPPNIAGSGRVGPRQRLRVTYSSQSEPDPSPINENPSILRQKSIEDSTKSRNFDQAHKMSSPRSPHHQRKSDFKNSYSTRKEEAMLPGTPKFSRKESERFDETTGLSRKESQKSPYPQKRVHTPNHASKFSRDQRKSSESFRNDSTESPQTQKKNITESDSSQGIRRNNDAAVSTVDSFSASDKPNDQMSQVAIKDDENACSDTQAIAESSSHSVSKNTDSEPRKNHPPENSAAQKNQQSLVLDSSNKDSKASNANLNDDGNLDNSLDDIESSDIGMINCSLDSGVISNDSGYVELPNNDSIHDVSDNEVGTENNGSRSMPSTSRAEENMLPDENPEVKSILAQTKLHNDAVKVESTSFNDFQAPNDILQSQLITRPAESPDNEKIDTGSNDNNRLEAQEEKSATVKGEVPQSLEKPAKVTHDMDDPSEVPEALEEREVPKDTPTEDPQALIEPIQAVEAPEGQAEVQTSGESKKISNENVPLAKHAENHEGFVISGNDPVDMKNEACDTLLT